MHIYRQIYEFAASAGAFEGYVYRKKLSDIDMDAVSDWVGNLRRAYEHLPADVRGQFQSACDRTLGRAIQSLQPLLGKGHPVIIKLGTMVKGKLPASADDFNQEKGFKKSPV